MASNNNSEEYLSILTEGSGENRFPDGPLNMESQMTKENDRFGSLAVIQTDSSSMSGLGRKADTRLGPMSALTDTGRSETLRAPEVDAS